MSTATPRLEDNLLHARLSALRRRWRFVVTCRGTSWLFAALLATAVLAGWLDWRFHLPGLVRACLLAAGLAAAGLIVFRSLLAPLLAPTDDLSLALPVEERYPGLHDCLASAVP